jgi:hypothetical protein
MGGKRMTEKRQTEQQICDTLAQVLRNHQKDTDTIPVAKSFLWEVYSLIKKKEHKEGKL